MSKQNIGLLGATSLVGKWLRPLLQESWHVIAFSRQSKEYANGEIEWRRIDPILFQKEKRDKAVCILPTKKVQILNWICIAPIWVLPDYFGLLEAYGVRRIVVLSSTSRFIKNDSSDLAEQNIANHLIEGEAQLQVWAEKNGVEWVILRSTLIYGEGQDKNISEIASFARRFGFFPILGKADGLRQPIHAEDVACACISALKSSEKLNRTYNISGGETLSYREMVRRVFVALNRQPCLVTIPLTAFRLVLVCLRPFPRYRHWSVAMAERMNRNLVFDHSDARRDFGFSPRPFRLTPKDVLR